MSRNDNKRLGKALLLSVVSTFAIAAFSPAQAQSEKIYTIDLPAGPLDDALLSLGNELGVNILATENQLVGRTAPAVSGALSAQTAINQLLVGSGLTALANEEGDFVLVQAPSIVPDSEPSAVEQVDTVDQVTNTSSVQETVFVTGTRIERTAANAPSPVSIYSREELQKFGFADLSEAIRFTPALNQSIGTLSSVDPFGSTNAGLASLDLRGLGASRTLVLVDGRRHVAGVPGEATVDVASIPGALIERVEVLTGGGGSAIYGADAVSGVVNYILKKDFEGVEYQGSVGVSDEGDGENFFGSLTVGGNFANDRGNAWLNVELSRQTSVSADSRQFNETFQNNIVLNEETAALFGLDPAFSNGLGTDRRSTFQSANGNIDLQGLGFSGLFGPFISQGIFELNGVPLVQIVDDTGTLRPFDFGVQSGFLFACFECDGELGTDFSVVPETNRIVLNGRSDFDVSDKVTVFLEGKYSFSGTEARTFQDGAPLVDIPIGLDNAFLPEGLQPQIDTLNAQGITPNILLSRALEDEAILPFSDIDRETFRIVGGLEGEISDDLSYDVSINYGRTDSEVTLVNNILVDRFGAATDAVIDPDTGNIVCRTDLDPTAPIPGNLFIPATIPGINTFNA
ncbi:MAG: TonB-dependent receptor, partial [Pseudomonadota bacterium]